MGLKQWYPKDIMWEAIGLWENGVPLAEIATKLDLDLYRLKDHFSTWGYTPYARRRIRFELTRKTLGKLVDE